MSGPTQERDIDVDLLIQPLDVLVGQVAAKCQLRLDVVDKRGGRGVEGLHLGLEGADDGLDLGLGVSGGGAAFDWGSD